MQCQTVTETQMTGKAGDVEKDRKSVSEDDTEEDCVGGSESKNDPP